MTNSAVQRLFDEINKHNLDGVHACLEQGIDSNSAGRGGETPLQAAVARGTDDELILLLLNHGADINRGNRFGETPLMLTARMGYPGIVRLLLKHGASVDAQDKGGTTALMNAVMNDHYSLQELIGAGADIHHKNSIGLTPLDYAFNSKQYSSAYFLVQAGAQVELAKFSGGRHAKMAAYWALHSAPALHAVEAGNYELLKMQLEQGTPADTRRGDDGKEPLLVTASERGHFALVRLLLENGADVHIEQSVGGRTALKVAKREEVIQLLREYGA